MRASQIVVVCGLLALLLLASCRSSDDVVGKRLPAGGDQAAPVDSGDAADDASKDASKDGEPVASAGGNETSAEPKGVVPVAVKPVDLSEVANITEAPTYELKNQCTADKVGVVRIFDEEGRKKVFRPFCDSATKSVVTFSCVDGIARPTSKSCPFDCYVPAETGIATCRATALPPHTPPKVRN